jgi:hypothetical protein
MIRVRIEDKNEKALKSWAKFNPATASMSMAQIVNFAISSLLFSTPRIDVSRPQPDISKLARGNFILDTKPKS